MTESSQTEKKKLSADWFLRGALTKIGDMIDRFTGRRWLPSSSLATSELAERIKTLLDSEAKQIPGKGTVVPHNISLKVQWDKFAPDSDDGLQKLEQELVTATIDHINDSLFYTFAPVKLRVKPDYFTEGVKLNASFDSFSAEESEAEMNVTVPSIKLETASETAVVSEPLGEVFIARFELKGSRRDKKIEFPRGGRISVGRIVSNELMIDDISVSKIHAALVANPDSSLSVADTGSTNGTFINGQRISYGKTTKLAERDKVKNLAQLRSYSNIFRGLRLQRQVI